MLSEVERLACLRLIRSEHVGPVTYRHLLGRFGSAEAALAGLPALARKGGRRRPIRIYPQPDAERELDGLSERGGRMVMLGEAAYPAALAALEDAPPVLSLLGRSEVLSSPAVAIVGARNASANACRFAETLAQGLGEAEHLVVSGLARGIDTAAHRGALATGTLAVLAGGVDVVYPPQNRGLYEDIRERGLLLSEVPLGTQPQARHFPRRNRLISGLSKGVVVVEAALRSGSLITARFAADQGREVMAVPGSPLDPRAKGCNSLIKQGATLIDSLDDVLQAITPDAGWGFRPPSPQVPPVLADAAVEKEAENGKTRLLELLGPSPVAVDELVRRCHLSAAAVSVALLELELAGRLERHPGARVSLVLDAKADAGL